MEWIIWAMMALVGIGGTTTLLASRKPKAKPVPELPTYDNSHHEYGKKEWDDLFITYCRDAGVEVPTEYLLNYANRDTPELTVNLPLWEDPRRQRRMRDWPSGSAVRYVKPTNYKTDHSYGCPGVFETQAVTTHEGVVHLIHCKKCGWSDTHMTRR